MELNLIAPINNMGYGVASKNILKALVEEGVKVALQPMGPIQYSSTHEAAVKLALSNEFNPDNPTLKIWHQYDLSCVGNPTIGFPFFELDTLSSKEVESLKSVDRVFVCSKWAQSVLQKYDIDSKVVPLGVDTEIFKPSFKKPGERFVFLNVGKWEVRKGHLELAQAFAKAFGPDDPVELWMMNDNPFYTPEQTKWWQGYYRDLLGNRVKFIPRQYSEIQVCEIMNKADAGVFPAKAEGWNLELLEMMALGKPVIATNYAGHTEFCTDYNSFLLPFIGFEQAEDKCPAHPQGMWFKGQGNWARIDFHSLVTHLKWIYSTRSSDVHNLVAVGLNTAKRFTWTNTAKRIIDEIV